MVAEPAVLFAGSRWDVFSGAFAHAELSLSSAHRRKINSFIPF